MYNKGVKKKMVEVINKYDNAVELDNKLFKRNLKKKFPNLETVYINNSTALLISNVSKINSLVVKHLDSLLERVHKDKQLEESYGKIKSISIVTNFIIASCEKFYFTYLDIDFKYDDKTKSSFKDSRLELTQGKRKMLKYDLPDTLDNLKNDYSIDDYYNHKAFKPKSINDKKVSVEIRKTNMTLQKLLRSNHLHNLAKTARERQQEEYYRKRNTRR